MSDGASEADPNTAKLTSLATRKFEFEDMINADPQCPIPALKIARAYLRFISNFETDAAYVSIIDLQVATGLSTRTIIDTRNKLIELGYFVPAGKTGLGAVRYRLKFARENAVLDHMMIARETLRRIDAERKEKQRMKRRTVQPDEPVIEPNAVTEDGDVIERNAGPSSPVPCTSYRDVIEPNAGNYLENNLEVEGFEGERGFEGLNSYALAKDGGDPHLPYPIPETETEAVAMLSSLFEGCDLSPAFIAYFRRKLFDGELTLAMVEKHLRIAA